MFNRHRGAFLAASFLILAACSSESGEGEKALSPVQAPAAASSPATPAAPAKSVQDAPAPAPAPVVVADAGAPVQDAAPEPEPAVEPVDPPGPHDDDCLTCGAKLEDKSSKAFFCAGGKFSDGSELIYKDYLSCVCGPCAEVCADSFCSATQNAPASATCQACLGYTDQICHTQKEACLADKGPWTAMQ
jgi:hypothetical protein